MGKKINVISFFVIVFLMSSCANGKIEKKSSVDSKSNNYDAVVIGAGGGGLSAAARLSMGGMKVLVIEQHNKVGGYMTTFSRGNYTFEVSLHAMDGLDPGGFTHKTFTKLGIIDKVKPIKIDPMYSLHFPDFTIEVPANIEAYQNLLKEKFPHEKKGIDKLFADLDTLYKSIRSLNGVHQNDYAGYLWRILKKPWIYCKLFKYRNSTLSEMLNDYIHDEKLRSVFTIFYSYAGCEPDRLSAILFVGMWNSYHRDGYYYFKGGSQSVSDALADVIRKNNGEIMLNTLATKIIIENGKAVGVQTKDGKKFLCRYVVSNANAPSTFNKLIGREYLPEKYMKKIDNMKIGYSAFEVYLGVDHDYKDAFPIGVHEYFNNETFKMAENVRYFTEGIPEKTTFMITNYSLIEPDNAPKGKNVITLTAILPYNWKNGWYEKEDYNKYTALKKEVADIFIKRAEKVLPGLSNHIEEIEIGSPRTMEHYTLNPMGSIIGWEYTPKQSLLNRLPQKTPIDNLYLAGAWTYIGGGQSAVLASGLMAAEMILDEEK